MTNTSIVVEIAVEGELTLEHSITTNNVCYGKENHQLYFFMYTYPFIEFLWLNFLMSLP